MSETNAIGARGFLIRGTDNTVYFRVYAQDNGGDFVDYELTHHDCEIVIIDPSAALIKGEHGEFLDYTTESMQSV